MKVDELRVLEEDELSGKLRTARRELYELRFKHAVGQLENSSQIAKVRHDIARIMTVLNERELGISSIQEPDPELVGAVAKQAAAVDSGFVEDEPEAQAETVDAEPVVAEVEVEAAKPKRTRRAKAEKDS
jgi:large subunit ribosomal protein L29